MSHVVVIDTSIVVRKIVATSMSRMGVSCLSFSDSHEALRALRAATKLPPDLIFLESNVARMQGFEFLRLLKSSPAFQAAVIVMLAADDGVLDRVKCRLAGAQGYLVKPFRTQDLLEMAATYLPALPVREESQPMSARGAFSSAL